MKSHSSYDRFAQRLVNANRQASELGENLFPLLKSLVRNVFPSCSAYQPRQRFTALPITAEDQSPKTCLRGLDG